MIKKHFLNISNNLLLFHIQKFSSSSHFRDLTKKESEAVDLYDFRNSSLNNKVLITCEHATNE